jgi:AcrR family transcriptional regulator
MNDDLRRESIIVLNAEPRHERADAATNRRLILETAAELFAAQGSEHVTMADIATAAGVGKGTLYRRFSSKGDLALALMNEQMTAFQEESLEELRWAVLARKPYLLQLEDFLLSLVPFVEEHLPLLCVVQQERLLQNDRAHQAPYFWQYQTVSGLLRRAIRDGELSAEIDVSFTADALLAPLRVDMYRLQRETRGFSLERIRDGMRSLIAALASL